MISKVGKTLIENSQIYKQMIEEEEQFMSKKKDYQKLHKAIIDFISALTF